MSKKFIPILPQRAMVYVGPTRTHEIHDLHDCHLEAVNTPVPECLTMPHRSEIRFDEGHPQNTALCSSNNKVTISKVADEFLINIQSPHGTSSTDIMEALELYFQNKENTKIRLDNVNRWIWAKEQS